MELQELAPIPLSLIIPIEEISFEHKVLGAGEKGCECG
jgi:hypothetical protein